MIAHYIKIAYRSFRKHLLYSGINIFGFSLSLSLCLIAIGHISYEISFENFQVNKDRIVRVEANYSEKDDHHKTALFSSSFGKSLKANIPEIETVSIIRVKEVTSIKVGETRRRVEDPHPGAMHSHGNKLVFADAEYFQVFTFPLVQGEPQKVLQEPFSLVISEKIADEYFPGENPLGKRCVVNDIYDCHVTGILKNTPYNTQLHTDFIVSFNTLERIIEPDPPSGRAFHDLIYLLLKANVDYSTLIPKVEELKNTFFKAEDAAHYSMYLMPFNDLMFRGFPGARGELNPRAEESMIYTLAIIAAFILIMAVSNFINLSTARSLDRMKEVGVRKTFGAGRINLIYQFYSEAILLTAISTLVGLILYEMLRAYMESIVPREMFVKFYQSQTMIIGVILLVIVVGILAGFYPALYLSRFKPITIFQNKIVSKSSRSFLRKGLVVFQFAIASVFIFVTIVMYQQTKLLTSMDLGFKKDNMMILKLDGDNAVEKCGVLKNEIMRNTNVLSATAVSVSPGSQEMDSYLFYTNPLRREEDMVVVKTIDADENFLSTFGLQLVEGRYFSSNKPEDINNGLIINESAKKELKTDKLLGYRFYREDGFYEVIGVVKDFHAAPLNFAYHPIHLLRSKPDNCKTLILNLPDENIPTTIASIKSIWEKTMPGEMFSYSFVDDEIKKSNKKAEDANDMFGFLCFVSIGIACLGIFGLVSFTADQKTKEIGIRKVMGASVTNIVGFLSKEFTWLIIIASIIAWPVGYLFANDLLGDYPFKVTVGIWNFIFTGSLIVMLALVSAGLRAYRAARANPIESLRYE